MDFVNDKMEKFQFLFIPNPWTYTFGKCNFLLFKNRYFYCLETLFLLSRTSPNKFALLILPKNEKMEKKNQFFDQNHGLIPLEKCIYFGFLKSMFFLI